jgi:hypothetical protein
MMNAVRYNTVQRHYGVCGITVHVLMNGNERGVKGEELLAVFGTSMSKGFLDNGVPETIKGRNILGQRLRPGVFKEKQIL